MNWIKRLFHRESKPKYVKWFSIENTTPDSLLFPRNTLYYESIYGITPKGETKFIRNTMEYASKEDAKRERELIMEVLKSLQLWTQEH